jgi:hypothetical protein
MHEQLEEQVARLRKGLQGWSNWPQQTLYVSFLYLCSTRFLDLSVQNGCKPAIVA